MSKSCWSIDRIIACIIRRMADFPFNAPQVTLITPRPPQPLDATTIAAISESLTQNITVTGNVTSSTLNVTGASTLAALGATNVTASGTLAVTGAASAAHFNATPTVPALPANPPVSGTVYQNTTGGPINIIIPITATAIGGSAQLALGSTNTPGAWGGAEQIGVSAELHNVSLRVPNNWYWSVTVANATIGTANVLGE